jgi:hypothetical protein
LEGLGISVNDDNGVPFNRNRMGKRRAYKTTTCDD